MPGFAAPEADLAYADDSLKKKTTAPAMVPGELPLDAGKPEQIGPPIESSLVAGARTVAGGVAGGLAGIAGAPVAAATGPYAPLTEALIIATGSRAAQNMVNYAAEQFGLRTHPGPKPGMSETLNNEIFGTANETAAQLAGSGIGALITNRVISPLAGKFFRQPTPQMQAEALETFMAAEANGVPVEGMAHMIGNRRTKEFVRASTSLPLFSNPKLEQEMANTDEAMGKVFAKVIDDYAGGAKSPTQVGNIVKAGLVDGRQAMRKWAGNVEESLAPNFKRTEPIRVDNFMAAYQNAKDVFSVRPRGASAAPEGLADATIPDELAKMVKIVESSDGLLTYDQIRALRTELRVRMNKPVFLQTPDDQKMATAYKALNEDLDAVFAKKGTKVALEWKNYNSNYKNYASEFGAIETIADSKFAYEAFDALKRGDKRSGEMLWKVRKQLNIAGMPESAWQDVVALRLTELGEKDGQFNFSQFSKAIDRMDDSAKRALFDIPGKRSAREAVDGLVTLARSRAKLNVPDSGSPRGIAYNEAIMHPLTYIAPLSAVSGYSVGKLLSSRDFVKWLADGQGYSKMDGRGLTAHMARLTTMMGTDPTIAGPIKEYYRVWQEARKERQETVQ